MFFFNTVDKSWKMLPVASNGMPARWGYTTTTAHTLSLTLAERTARCRECHTSTAVGSKLYTFGGLGDRPAQVRAFRPSSPPHLVSSLTLAMAAGGPVVELPG